VIFREENVGGRERVTTDEERAPRGGEQRSHEDSYLKVMNETDLE